VRGRVRFCTLNRGAKAGYLACALALNFTFIEIYKGKQCGIRHVHDLVHVDISRHAYFSDFTTTPSFSMRALQSFIHEALAGH